MWYIAHCQFFRLYLVLVYQFGCQTKVYVPMSVRKIIQQFWNREGQGGHSQYLSEQLTLFELGRADYPHLLLLDPPMFFTFRHHCSTVQN